MKWKFYLHNFLGNIVVHIRAKYQKDQMKNEGAYSICNKFYGPTDRQTDEGGLGIG